MGDRGYWLTTRIYDDSKLAMRAVGTPSVVHFTNIDIQAGAESSAVHGGSGLKGSAGRVGDDGSDSNPRRKREPSFYEQLLSQANKFEKNVHQS